MIQFTYGLAAIVSLWAMGGGNIDLYWKRQLVLAVVMIALAALNILTAKKKHLLKADPKSIRLGLISGLVSALPIVAMIIYLKTKGGAPWILELIPPNFGAIIIFALLLSPAAEIISRGFFLPAWGLGSVAFLDALTVGFGLQKLYPFLAIWAMGFIWGTLSTRFTLMTAVISRAIWSMLVLSALFF